MRFISIYRCLLRSEWCGADFMFSVFASLHKTNYVQMKSFPLNNSFKLNLRHIKAPPWPIKSVCNFISVKMGRELRITLSFIVQSDGTTFIFTKTNHYKYLFHLSFFLTHNHGNTNERILLSTKLQKRKHTMLEIIVSTVNTTF